MVSLYDHMIERDVKVTISIILSRRVHVFRPRETYRDLRKNSKSVNGKMNDH